MKKTILSAALALAFTGADAAPRTAEQALEVARRFALESPQLYNVRQAELKLASIATVQMAKGQTHTLPAYYVCNLGDEGFVVVSGDDRFKEVLGYSLNGAYSYSDMPDGLRYWLSFLSNEMGAAIDAGYQGGEASAAVQSASALQSVEPLLKTKWNQGSPYNKQIGNNMTGCVATGTAQVMNYWKYPVHGTGNHKAANAPNYYADFANTTYDWANMLPMYGRENNDSPTAGRETQEQINAVSTLMLHLGVATDMNWGTNQSATANPFAAYALHNYFGYNPNLYIETRDQLSLGAWKALLIDQLQTGHPLCYSGMNQETGGVGHFFVCDGYDAQTGLFHFNWGWAGRYDGYFDVTALEPGTGGIGAGAGKFNYWQSIFVNVQPEPTGEYFANFNATEIKIGSTKNNANIEIGLETFYNQCTKSFKGTIGVAVYAVDGTLKSYIPADVTFPPAGFNIGHNYSTRYSYVVNMSSLASDNYVVCPAVKSDEGQIYPIRAKYDNATYFALNVSGKDFTFKPTSHEVQFADDSSIELTSNAQGDVFQNVVAEFKLIVKNTSSQTFNDEIGVRISKSRGSKFYIMQPAVIAPGETKEIIVKGIIPTSLNINDGYTAQPCYGVNSIYDNMFGKTMTINVKSQADGIEYVTVSDAQQSHIIYNIAGQRVDDTAKGIVIINGKKVVKNK